MGLDHHPPQSYQALFFEEPDAPLPLLLLPYRCQWWFPFNAVAGVTDPGLPRAVGDFRLPAKPPGRPLPLRRRRLLRLRLPNAPRSRSCPPLEAWLCSAYLPAAPPPLAGPLYDDMPLLPDDTETCVLELGKAMAAKKVELPRPNSTCDLAYCYCGIRLHPFTCPAAGDTKALRNLELHCKSDNNGADCSKCLRALYQVKASTFFL